MVALNGWYSVYCGRSFPTDHGRNGTANTPVTNWRSSILGSARPKIHRSVSAADAWTHFGTANSRNYHARGRPLAAAAKSVQDLAPSATFRAADGLARYASKAVYPSVRDRTRLRPGPAGSMQEPLRRRTQPLRGSPPMRSVAIPCRSRERNRLGGRRR